MTLIGILLHVSSRGSSGTLRRVSSRGSSGPASHASRALASRALASRALASRALASRALARALAPATSLYVTHPLDGLDRRIEGSNPRLRTEAVLQYSRKAGGCGGKVNRRRTAMLASMKRGILVALSQHHLARRAQARLVASVFYGRREDGLFCATPHPAPSCSLTQSAAIFACHSTVEKEVI